MNEYLTWGGAGILLAVAGTAIIASEIQYGLTTGQPMYVAYGVAVVLATLITIAIIAPSFISRD